MKKVEIIKSGKINTEGIKKVGKGALIGLAGYLLSEIPNILNVFDFGEYQPIMVVVLGIGVNYLRKLLLPYTSK